MMILAMNGAMNWGILQFRDPHVDFVGGWPVDPWNSGPPSSSHAGHLGPDVFCLARVPWISLGSQGQFFGSAGVSALVWSLVSQCGRGFTWNVWLVVGCFFSCSNGVEDPLFFGRNIPVKKCTHFVTGCHLLFFWVSHGLTKKSPIRWIQKGGDWQTFVLCPSAASLRDGVASRSKQGGRWMGWMVETGHRLGEIFSHRLAGSHVFNFHFYLLCKASSLVDYISITAQFFCGCPLVNRTWFAGRSAICPSKWFQMRIYRGFPSPCHGIGWRCSWSNHSYNPSKSGYLFYPLVNIPKTMEHAPFFMVKSVNQRTFPGHFQ